MIAAIVTRAAAADVTAALRALGESPSHVHVVEPGQAGALLQGDRAANTKEYVHENLLLDASGSGALLRWEGGVAATQIGKGVRVATRVLACLPERNFTSSMVEWMRVPVPCSSLLPNARGYRDNS